MPALHWRQFIFVKVFNSLSISMGASAAVNREVFVRSVHFSTDKTFSVEVSLRSDQELTASMLDKAIQAKLKKKQNGRYGYGVAGIYRPRADGTSPCKDARPPRNEIYSKIDVVPKHAGRFESNPIYFFEERTSTMWNQYATKARHDRMRNAQVCANSIPFRTPTVFAS